MAGQERRCDRHRTLDEGLRCEPLLAVPLTLALLALGTFVLGMLASDASGGVTRFWVTACTVFIAAHCLFTAVYDSPNRHAARVARGCPHIRPASVEQPAIRRTIRR